MTGTNRSMQEAMHTAGRGASQERTASGEKQGEMTYCPPMDVFEFDDRYEVHAELAGSAPDQINVTVGEGVLTIEARVPARYEAGIQPLVREYGVGDYRRQVRLGTDVDSEKLEGRYADGVLLLTLPKRAEQRPRRVLVSGG
ncbi:MAG TPA: Hsp20/alpha crystallin family protein [Phycisphaerales bacterium]|nr:Hsp20/alpha crystallin family protein [Phycisphaerales bacterium]